MNFKRILYVFTLALAVICLLVLIAKRDKTSTILTSDFLYKLPDSQPVNIIWYTQKNGGWKINKSFTSQSEIKELLGLLQKGKFSLKPENGQQKEFIKQNIKDFEGTEKLSVIFYNGQAETLEVKELSFCLEDHTFKWAMGQSKLLYQMLSNKNIWDKLQPLTHMNSNYTKLTQKRIQDGIKQQQKGFIEEINSFDWVEHVYQKKDWLPIRIMWFNMADISELEPEGIYKKFRFHENPEDFKKIIMLLANPEKTEQNKIVSKTKLVLLFYVPEKDMLKSRDVIFTLKEGVYYGPNGQSQELGMLLEKAPIFLTDFSSHYEDFEPDGLKELRNGWQ